jgi:UDP-N-acetylglucosamine--N-acetylmuramyl-(pentapeptide) pyrophosphoryl-undecaprenol N-acetylglucosamine transferase
MRVLFAAGGTGGHIIPARNLAEWLDADADSHEVRFLTAGRTIENAFFELERWRRRPLFEGYASRPSLFRPRAWFRAAAWARQEIKSFRPHALVLSGGYVSLPALLGWGVFGRYLYVLEQNALPGKTVRLATLPARRIFCHFEAAAKKIGGKAVVTGSPLPPGFGETQRLPLEGVRKSLGLKPELMTLLVAGGSQGAKAVNDLVLDRLHLIDQYGMGKIQVLHVAGPNDFERVQYRHSKSGVPSVVKPFLDPMESAYRAADLVICRGGGMTIAEVTGFGLPAVVVPYPHHKDMHQYANALEVREAGGAVILEEKNFSDDAFHSHVIEVLLKPPRLLDMSQRSRDAGRLSGGGHIVEVMKKDTRSIDPASP